MLEHAFGGSWTEKKLDALRNYLAAYRSVFSRTTYFTTWYVDAFAGTGSRTVSSLKSVFFDSDEVATDAEASSCLDGSAKIALGLTNPFDCYLFIEKSKPRAHELNEMIRSEFPNLASRCQVIPSDAKSALSTWSGERNWSRERAVVFLDPYGMQVEWDTVRMLAGTKAIDLWYLFPFGVIRMLTKDGNIEESWQKRLDILFGATDWREHFYKTETVANLFGEEDVTSRDAGITNVQAYVEARLRAEFEAVAPSLVLRNSKSSPLFALCFAVGNKKGAPIALRIAKSILKED